MIIDMTVIDGPVLLYDDACGLCHASVQFVLQHDKKRTLRFASLEGEFGRSVVDEHPELEGVDSVVWVEPSTDDRRARVLIRSEAALRAARYLGGAWKLLVLFAVVPRPIRDWGYDVVARHRHRLLGTGQDCFIPPPAARNRFLDE